MYYKNRLLEKGFLEQDFKVWRLRVKATLLIKLTGMASLRYNFKKKAPFYEKCFY